MQHVVVKLVLLVPKTDAFATEIAHRFGDIQKVLEELCRHIFIDVVVFSEREGDAHQVQRVHPHPRRAVGLIDMPAGRQWRATIENPDIVEAKKAALEDVTAFRVLAVDPPRKVQQQLMENAFEKRAVGDTMPLAIHLVHPPRRPRMHRWVDVAKGPFIRR